MPLDVTIMFVYWVKFIDMSNTLLAVVIVAIIGIVGWLAYSQGYFQGAQEEQGSGLEKKPQTN